MVGIKNNKTEISLLGRLMHCLTRCEEGATMLIFGLGFLTLVAAVGISVDYGRAQMVQTKLQAALDSAALAAAATANDVQNSAKKRELKLREANKFMEANFPKQYMRTFTPSGGNGYITNIKILTDEKGRDSGIIMDAAGEVKTMITRIAGFARMDVAAHTEIALDTEQVGLEIAMVLDNTGSMAAVVGGEARIDALKRASRQAIDDIYQRFDRNRTWIGVVPFRDHIRVGGAKAPGAKWLSGGSSAAVNCLYSDSGGTPPRTPTSHYAENVAPLKAGDRIDYTDTNCNIASITPLTSINNRDAIKAGINAMQPSGATRIDWGAIWGLRLIAPAWSGDWRGHGALPYKTEDIQKAVIILTDGENCADPLTKCGSSFPHANNRLSRICNVMKEPHRDIQVYTVTLHLTDGYTKNLMRQCATTTQHYFHVPPGGDLKDAFDQIVESLANLRISR